MMLGDIGRLWDMARRWVKRWAWRHDPTLIEDCWMAGCEAWLAHEAPRRWWAAQNAIQNEICHELYGRKKRGQPYRLGSPRARWALHRRRGSSVELQALRRIGLQRLIAQCQRRRFIHARPHKTLAVLHLLMEQGNDWDIPKDLQRRYGVGYRALYNGKRKLRSIAVALELDQL